MVLFVALAVALAVPGQGAQNRSYSGRPVAEVLQELRAAGLKVIFSTDLVPPTLRVKAEPTVTDPLAIALQILQPHGLTLQPGPRGTALVVTMPRKDRSPPPRKTPAQPPAAKPSGKGAAPEPLRIEEEVN